MKFSNESLSISAEEMFSISNSWVPETGNIDRIILEEAYWNVQQIFLRAIRLQVDNSQPEQH